MHQLKKIGHWVFSRLKPSVFCRDGKLLLLSWKLEIKKILSSVFQALIEKKGFFFGEEWRKPMNMDSSYLHLSILQLWMKKNGTQQSRGKFF
jgi:hypothetical protein